MDKDYIDKKIQSDSLVRIANAIEEILRLVKKVINHLDIIVNRDYVGHGSRV